jgi:hypothetical protein
MGRIVGKLVVLFASGVVIVAIFACAPVALAAR